MPRSELVPGSLTHRVAATLLAETTAVGHSVTLNEWREAHTQRADEALGPSINGPIGALRRAGIAVVVSGRHGRRQYMHRDHPVPAVVDGDFAMVVLEVLRAECIRLNRPVSTREVRRALDARGLRPSLVDGPAGLLRSLTRPSLVTEPGSYGTPRVVLFPKRTVHGRPVNCWAPADMTFVLRDGAQIDVDGEVISLEDVPADSQRAAVRQVIAAMEQELGCAVSRQEIGWWIRLHAGDHPAAAAIDARRLAGTLSDMARRGAGASGERGGSLATLRNEFTAAGAGPVRYYMHLSGAALARAAAGCRLEDACTTYQFGAERREILRLETLIAERLRERGEAIEERQERLYSSDFVATKDLDAWLGVAIAFADERRFLLATLVLELVGDGTTGALQGLLRSVQAREEWLRALHETGQPVYTFRGRHSAFYSMRTRILRLVADVEAIRDIMEEHPPSLFQGSDMPRTKRQRARCVGELVAPLDDRIWALAEAAAGVRELPGAQVRNVIKHARRFGPPLSQNGLPSPRMGQEPFAGGVERARIDPVDAVLCCFWKVGAWRANAMLQEAHTLLGHVLRDPRFVRGRISSRMPFSLKSTLVIALAMLGEFPDIEDLLEEGMTWQFETALLAIAIVDPLNAEAHFGKLYGWNGGGPGGRTSGDAQLLDSAIDRMREGRYLTVIE